ncbi:30S ribosomal protein S3 [Candidatus Pacearchaeota archaeon]|nr:30S ribosomal protein S3 [Candidatus Pacearchaeota archaeon]
MEERKFVDFKKGEYRVKEFIKESLGRGKASKVIMEYTPVGEKVVVFTNKPGYIIGKQGAKINELTVRLKKNFKLENPHIEIAEIPNPDLDAQTVADEIALALERFGNVRFKAITYKYLQRVMSSKAQGVEIRVSGKLPGERAKTWRFSQGYLKKTGESSRVVDRAKAVAQTKSGIIGVKVSILPPDAPIHDQIIIDDNMKNKIKQNLSDLDVKNEEISRKESEKKAKKETQKKDKKEKETQKKSKAKRGLDEDGNDKNS